MRYFAPAPGTSPAAQAILYLAGAARRRVVLPGPSPARQLGRWLQQQAADPGFVPQVRRILLLTAAPPCPACVAGLRQVLDGLGLRHCLRLPARRPAAGYLPAPALLDELLTELENPQDDAPDSQPLANPQPGYRQQAPPPPPPTPAELAALKAQQERAEAALRLAEEKRQLEEEKRRRLEEQKKLNSWLQRQLAEQARRARATPPRPATWKTVPPPTWQDPTSPYKALPPVRVKTPPLPPASAKVPVLPARTTTGWRPKATKPGRHRP